MSKKNNSFTFVKMKNICKNMDSVTRARYQARITDLESKRAELSKTLDSALKNAEIESFEFNDPEGGQISRRRSPAILNKLLAEIDHEIDSLQRKLSSSGLHIANMRRIP